MQRMHDGKPILMRPLGLFLLVLGVGVSLSEEAQAQGGCNIAVFGDDRPFIETKDFIDGPGVPGCSADMVTDAQIATPGFLSGYDAFFMTRAAFTQPGRGLSVEAAQAVVDYEGSTGNVVLFNCDCTDALLDGQGEGGQDTRIETIIANAVQWAAESGHGVIGEFNGMVSALTSNSNGFNPLSLVDGSAGSLGEEGLNANRSMFLADAGSGHPVLAGVEGDFPFNPNSVEFRANVTGVPDDLVLVRWDSSTGMPAIFVKGGGAGNPGPPDHYLAYQVKRSRDAPRFERRKVMLEDQFSQSGPQEFTIKKPVALLNPADKNGEGISDPDTHLIAYSLKGPKFKKRRNVQVDNQFGAFLLDVKRSDRRLLVPASKDPDNPPEPLDGTHHVNHFLCYDVDERRRRDDDDDGDDDDRVRITVSVAAQFNQSAPMFEIRKPVRLCNPVDKNSEGIKDEENHLLCFQVKPVRRRDTTQRVKDIHVRDQFGQNQVDTLKIRELCVPSTKTLLPADDDDD